MTADRRSEDRQNLEAMTHEFLQNGGRIVQCPPGSSEAVVYKKGSFKRRQAQKPEENGAKVEAPTDAATSADASPADVPPVAPADGAG